MDSGFSVDIEELFYSVPHEDSFLSVRNCIRPLKCHSRSETPPHLNASGISVGGLLELLHVYLTSTYYRRQSLACSRLSFGWGGAIEIVVRVVVPQAFLEAYWVWRAPLGRSDPRLGLSCLEPRGPRARRRPLRHVPDT
ncbi:hypothetical protein HPB50_001200 [Hyalomma asiaticum]|uniref:Uncharacterized protein n=1 Tax=Hyalomma asiaticum TaxID=266040 RepID=A0ACB7TAP2_HYAAI|nr:hypothetical protein HPB50_001200 [Hyalomma asiaticum]